MAVQAQGFMVQVIRGTAPDQDIGVITVVINPGQAAKIVKETIMVRAINHIIKVVTIIRVISSRAKGIIIIREISSHSASNSSRNLDIRVIQRS